MIDIIKNPEQETWSKVLSRPELPKANLDELVNSVFQEVRLNGDIAVSSYTKDFDRASLTRFRVSQDEIMEASSLVNDELKAAIQLAKNNISKFHNSQVVEEEKVETMKGVTCWRKSVGIESVGLYIPGGTAPLFSTVLMLGIPATIAGCKNIVLCTPPDVNGKINPAIIYTASLVGITQIFKVGGIQSIAAMTFGTEQIPSVDKIFGPGNQYVTAAKQKAVKFGVSIDMPAGPSEVLVYADESSNPAFVAADLLAQAEHGVDSQVICLSTSLEMLENVNKELAIQVENLLRKSVCKEALSCSKLILVDSERIVINMINYYAPEHLILMSKNEDSLAEEIINAGSVFIGENTPESAGDYASGTNHTLPTNGYAKSYSGVSVDSFVRKITFQKISKVGLENIGPSIEVMAEAELLDAHKNAVTIRLKS